MIDKIKKLVSHNDRIGWDEYFASLACLISCRSPSQKLKVGAVIVKDKRVISSGYNGYPAGCEHISIHRGGHEINTIHGEQNAISDASRRGVAIENATIYVTHYPCINCAKYIISSGINEVVYLDDYKNDDVVEEMFKQCKIFVRQFVAVEKIQSRKN